MRERRSKDPQLNEVSEDCARFIAALKRNDFKTCNNLVSQLEGKKKAESYKDPMLNDEARVEYMSNAGFLMVTLSYAVLYFRFAAFLGQKHTRVMTGLRIWSVILTLLLMLQMIMCSFVRFGTWKVMRFALAVLLFVSSIFIFVLLQLGL